MNRKQCPRCGAELPEAASFCPHCMADLADRRQVTPPDPSRRRWWLAVVLAGVLLYGLLPRSEEPEAPDSAAEHSMESAAESAVEEPDPSAEALPGEARVYDNGAAALNYAYNGKTYSLLAHFGYSPDGPCREPEPEFSVALEQDGTSDTMTMVTVVDHSGANAAEEFRACVEEVRLEAVNPENGPEALVVKEWGADGNYQNAAYVGKLRMNSADCDPGVAWVLTMKNGDTLVLRQTIHLSLLQKTIFDQTNADLSDIDGLKALLEKIEMELPADMVVDIYLPPVRYEGGLTIENHAVNLYGSNEGDAMTTFTGTVTVGTRQPVLPEFYGLRFEGSGGTGLWATSPVHLHDCSFTGWDTAAYMGDGSFILPMNCTFAGNGIGLHMDSVNSTASSSALPDNTFTGNGTALRIDGIPMAEPLGFINCLFRQNTVDIDNPSGHEIDPSGAVFE